MTHMNADMNAVYEAMKADITSNLPQKKWDNFIIAGEVYRCNTDPNKLNEENKKFSCSIKLNKEVFLALKKHDTSNGKLTGLKNVSVRVKELDEEGNPIKDTNDKFVFVMDEETGEDKKEFSHYQISVYANPKRKRDGQWYDFEVPVVDAATGKPIQGVLAEGSKVAVSVSAYETVFRNNPAMGLNLNEIKVFEHVELEGSGGNDPWAKYGLSRTEVANMAPPPAPQQGSGQQSVPDMHSEPSGGDLDDDVPFMTAYKGMELCV